MPLRLALVSSIAALASLACASTVATAPAPGAPGETFIVEEGAPPPAKGPVPRPDHLLSPAEAVAYGLALINADRQAAGLAPVTVDATASTGAARHVRDMVSGGFTAHWGTDGSVPELRYTEAGGTDTTTENVACFGDGAPRQLDDKGPFDPVEIERFQAAFMGEKPPSDGHRQNILTPWHNKVGLAYATAKGTKIVCVSQEFIDDYGTYGPLPQRARPGDTLKVTGDMRPPATFGGIGLAVVPLPKPRTPKELLATGTYVMPNPFIAYFPPGFKTPKPVDVQGNHFSLDLPLTNLRGPGLYHVQIFAHLPGVDHLVPVSLRTVLIP